MKNIVFCGSSLKTIKSFSERACHEIGYELERVQRGLSPVHWKPMSSVGAGVKEICLQELGQYRVLYVARHETTIYVLHAFMKKTQKTRKYDIKLARVALKKLPIGK